MGIDLTVAVPKVSLAPLLTPEALSRNGSLVFGNKIKTQPLSSSSILVSAGPPEHIVYVLCLALLSKSIVLSVLSLLTLANATVTRDGLTEQSLLESRGLNKLLAKTVILLSF